MNHSPRLTNLRSLCWPVHDDSPRRVALKIVLFGLSVHLLINILRALQCRLVGVPNLASLSLSFFDVLTSLALLLALLLIMFQETILQLKSSQVGAFAKAVDKYQRSALGPEERTRIRNKLEQALNDHTLIHDNSLNLRRLAEHIHEKPHYVSQVINQDLGTNFFDLINSVRIRNALPQLLVATPPAIVELAKSLGFNSKSTFYTAFAKHMGMTPSQYRQNQLLSD
jgi:AraC-like DNA-binding protein